MSQKWLHSQARGSLLLLAKTGHSLLGWASITQRMYNSPSVHLLFCFKLLHCSNGFFSGFVAPQFCPKLPRLWWDLWYTLKDETTTSTVKHMLKDSACLVGWCILSTYFQQLFWNLITKSFQRSKTSTVKSGFSVPWGFSGANSDTVLLDEWKQIGPFKPYRPCTQSVWP